MFSELRKNFRNTYSGKISEKNSNLKSIISKSAKYQQQHLKIIELCFSKAQLAFIFNLNIILFSLEQTKKLYIY